MERVTILAVMILVCIWICCSPIAVAQDAPEENTGVINLTWDPNTEADLDGYQVHRGETPGNYDTVTNVGNVNKYTAKGLKIGKKYYFALTAYDTSKNESIYSEEVSAPGYDRVGPEIPIGLKDSTPEATIIAETVNIETVNIINQQ